MLTGNLAHVRAAVEPENPEEICRVLGKWFAVATEPRREQLARMELSHVGFVVYSPHMVRAESHGRGHERHVLRPMFPGILFTKCEPIDDHWGIVRSRRGVKRLLGCTRPQSIPESAIEVVKLYEAEQAEKERKRQQARNHGKSGIIWDFQPGERVRIKHGPFAAFYAQLDMAVDDKDRIRALVDVFGRKSAIELSAFDIERIEI